MAMENNPFEDVFPIENEKKIHCYLSFFGGYLLLMIFALNIPSY